MTNIADDTYDAILRREQVIAQLGERIREYERVIQNRQGGASESETVKEFKKGEVVHG